MQGIQNVLRAFQFIVRYFYDRLARELCRQRRILFILSRNDAAGIRIQPGLSSAGYALAAGLGLILYAPAGAWSIKRGPLAVLRDALSLRIAAFFALTVLARLSLPGRGWLALLFFLFVVLAWSLLSVSSTALVAGLSPKNEGEGMGIFNAVTAVSGVIGAALGGWVAGLWGYAAIPIMGIVGVGAGLVVLSTSRLNSDAGRSGTQGGHQMKAVALTPGTTTMRLIELPEPRITSPDEIKVRMLRVGICGTDREEASGGRALAPQGRTELVIGHEMFGRVVETGRSVYPGETGRLCRVHRTARMRRMPALHDEPLGHVPYRQLPGAGHLGNGRVSDRICRGHGAVYRPCSR